MMARASASAALPTSGVQVFIPAALNRPSHTLYSICVCVQPTSQEWTVNRRYSQFLQLRKDLLAMLTTGTRRSFSPGSSASGHSHGHNGYGYGNRNNHSPSPPPCAYCATFALALRKFPFPSKTLLRTNRVVRRRVTSLQQFLQLIVAREYNDLPKCGVCGEQVAKMLRAFFIRGAKPVDEHSTIRKIQYSLSLQSYAVVDHHVKYTSYKPDASSADSTVSSSSQTATSNSESSSKHNETEADPSLALSHAESTDSYATNLGDGDETCHDDPVPLEQALKQVVMADQRNSTVEEIAFRLSTMWDGFDMRETAPRITNMRLTASQLLGSDTPEEDDEDEF